MGRGLGVPLKMKQQIAKLFDDNGYTKYTRREARYLYALAMPDANPLSSGMLIRIFKNRKELMTIEESSFPNDRRNKRINLPRKGRASADFKLEPIDDGNSNMEDSSVVKVEVFEIDEVQSKSEEATKLASADEKMIIEEIGADDVKTEVLEIHTGEDESCETKTETELLSKVEQKSSQEKFKLNKSTDFEDDTDFYIADKINTDVSSSPVASQLQMPGQSENELRCSKCGFKATHPLELARHRTFAHSLNCPQCAYTTNQDALLAKHILTHTEIKPFKCNLCSYASKTKADLSEHTEKHRQERRDIRCERCGFLTHSKSDLARHKARIHKEIVLNLYS